LNYLGRRRAEGLDYYLGERKKKWSGLPGNPRPNALENKVSVPRRKGRKKQKNLLGGSMFSSAARGGRG